MTALSDQQPSCPSFADLLEAVSAAPALSVTAKRDLKSAVVRIARWLGREPASVPADPKQLRTEMTNWTGAQFGVSDATLSVVLSQLRRALRLVAPARHQPKAKAPLTSDWQSLKDALDRYWQSYKESHGLVRSENWLRIRLGRFMRWCSTCGIAPNGVCDAVIARFVDDLAGSEVRGKIGDKERRLRQAWNYAAKHIGGWPATSLQPTRAPRPKPLVTLPESQFPSAFISELDAYAASRGLLRRDEPADEAGVTYLERLRRRCGRSRARLPNGEEAFGRRLQPLASATVRAHRRALVMAATALVVRGVKRIEDIRSLADVACPDGIAAVVDALEERRGSCNEYAASLVTTLLSIIARSDIQLAPDELSAIRELEAELSAESRQKDGELTSKNRTRMAQFDDPDNIALLISCSEKEMARLEAERRRKGRVTVAMARNAEAAIGNLLLLSLPVRRRALATIDRQRNFRPPTRRGGTATLVYAPEQCKTRRAAQVVLDAWKWRLVDTYWRDYRPLLNGAKRSSYLFPGNTASGHKEFGHLARCITRFVRRRTGLEMNLHLWRHAMGALLLEEHRDIRLVEELLGHVPGSRATRRYVELKTKWSAQALDSITDARRQRGRYLHARRDRRYDRRNLPA